MADILPAGAGWGAGGRVNAAATAAAPAPPAAAPSPVADTTGQSALDSLTDYLNTYGLGALAPQAWTLYKSGETNDQILTALRASDAYRQVFGSDAADLLKRGLFSNEGQILNYYNTSKALFQQYGIPDSVTSQWTSPDALNTLALGNVSPTELEQRLKDAQTAMTASINPQTQAELARTLGATPGDLTALWLDPKAKLPDLENRLQAGLIGGVGDQAGYGQVDVGRLLDLASQGVTTAQAQQGFSTLASEQQLFGALPGQQQATIDEGTQLGAAFGGNAQDQAAIEAARAQRRAAFGGSGAAQASSSGVSGVGINAS